ncbi:MAG: cytochrome oxidase [Myxococcota bacterium]
MSVIVLQVFVSLMLVAAGVTLFVFVVRSRTLEHSDRLSLAPLEDDVCPRSEPPAVQPPKQSP